MLGPKVAKNNAVKGLSVQSNSLVGIPWCRAIACNSHESENGMDLTDLLFFSNSSSINLSWSSRVISPWSTLSIMGRRAQPHSRCPLNKYEAVSSFKHTSVNSDTVLAVLVLSNGIFVYHVFRCNLELTILHEEISVVTISRS